MTDEECIATIRYLEQNIIGVRYLLEVYKIAYSVNLQAMATHKGLAALLANTYLRSLILNLCAIFSQDSDKYKNKKNLSLEKSLNRTFTTINNSRPELSAIISDSVAIMKKESLYKIRNKKIAHIDFVGFAPSLGSSSPEAYEKLVKNAETILTEILKENNIQPEREPPNQDTDFVLIQLKAILNS